jgi:transcriptional regulator with PAS, ATPase and Fis domain
LSVIPLVVPPLRERLEDLEALVEHFIHRWARGQKRRPRLAPDVLEALGRYGWPGNVRELENMVQRALALSQDGELTLDDFAFQIATTTTTTVRQEARDAEATKLRELLLFHGGNCSRAAAALGIPRTTLISRLKKYALI